MPTIDLSTPPPPPTGLLEALPRRVALTLAELRLVAQRAGGAPLPFDLSEPGRAHSLEGRLGESRTSAGGRGVRRRRQLPARPGVLARAPRTARTGRRQRRHDRRRRAAGHTAHRRRHRRRGRRRPRPLLAPPVRRRRGDAVHGRRRRLRAGLVRHLPVARRAGPRGRAARGAARCAPRRCRRSSTSLRARRRRHRGGPQRPLRPGPGARRAARRRRVRPRRSSR